jgi:PAS domain S-box-containing protein
MNSQHLRWLATAGAALAAGAALIGLCGLAEEAWLPAAPEAAEGFVVLRLLLATLVSLLFAGLFVYRRLKLTLVLLERQKLDAQSDRRATEHRLQTLLQTVPLAVVGLDRDGRVNYANPQFLALTGYAASEVHGQDWFDRFVPPRLRPPLRPPFHELLEREFRPHCEGPILTGAGTERVVAWSNTLLRGDDGSLAGTLSIGKDITNRRRGERELLASEARLRLLMRQLPGAVWTTDRELRLTFAPGGQLSEALAAGAGATLYEYFGTRDPGFPAIAAHLQALDGKHAHYEIDWAGRTLQAHVEPLLEAGQVVGAIGIALDVTERKRAEHDLVASEARYRVITEISAAGIWQIGPDGHTVYANPSMCALLELDGPEELRGQGFEAFLTPEGEETMAQAHELRRRGIASMHEVTLIGRHGRRSSVLVSGAPIFHPDGRLHSIIGTFTDISERKQMEQSLRESEQHYRALFDTTPYPVYVFDRDSLQILRVNEAAVRHYGYREDEFLRMKLSELRRPEDVPEFLAAYKPERPTGDKGLVTRHRKKDGTLIDVELSTHDFVFAGRRARLVLAVDVTERRRLEEQFRQAQKMEAVGRLAGGVAHDFNNALTVISGFSELLRKQLGAGHHGHQDVEEIRKAADRATGLTRQLLAFSRKNVLTPQVLDLNLLVGNVERMLRRLLGEDVELTTVPAPCPVWVKADPGQIEQVLVNLAINARDAMPDGGRLTVSVAHVQLDADQARARASAPAGWFALLKVADTGTGMSAQVRQHLFEPFFTTKPQGQGTGLGLFTAYGIVRHHQGGIDVSSEPGRGTAVALYLPSALPPAEKPAAAPLAELPGGSETVLLVEDEPILRSLLVRVLQGQGYNVLQATNGEDGLRTSGQHTGSIDLLVTDLVMPRMGGRELAERLATQRQSMKILFMSGYTDGALGRTGQGDGPVHFLQKPFLPVALANKVREVLESV